MHNGLEHLAPAQVLGCFLRWRGEPGRRQCRRCRPTPFMVKLVPNERTAGEKILDLVKGILLLSSLVEHSCMLRVAWMHN